MTKFNESEILHQKVAHLLRPEELTSINLMRWLKSYNWVIILLKWIFSIKWIYESYRMLISALKL